jgi:hypothetical protein
VTRARLAAAALLLLVLGVQAATIVDQAAREPHIDETEYLHAAWLMQQGLTLYVDFFEHHPPFLFAALESVAGDDLQPYLVRARLLSGACALIALAAFAAILWRTRAEAAPIALLLIYASQPLWNAGLTAVRVEPFAMAFFWSGAALILLARDDDRGAILAGIGLGLVALVALWSPKWPLSSAVAGAMWLVRTRRRVRSASIAAAMFALGVLLVHRLAPLDRVWFFNFEFNRVFWPILAKSPEVLQIDLHGGKRFLYAPVLFRPLTVALLAMVVAAALRRFGDERRNVIFFLLLATAALLELRFIFPWPAIWPHYYLMWTFAGAALAGLAPAAAGHLASMASARAARPVAAAVTVTALLIGAAQAIAVSQLGAATGAPYWVAQRFFRERLRANDTVWMDVARHPVTARDESYYWFGFEDVAHQLRRTPRGARYLPEPKDFPFCAAARGERVRTRFISVSRRTSPSPEQRACFMQLLARGALRRTPAADVYEFVH